MEPKPNSDKTAERPKLKSKERELTDFLKKRGRIKLKVKPADDLINPYTVVLTRTDRDRITGPATYESISIGYNTLLHLAFVTSLHPERLHDGYARRKMKSASKRTVQQVSNLVYETLKQIDALPPKPIV